MKYNEYKSNMLSHVRNAVPDLNKIAGAVTFDYLRSCVPEENVKKAKRVVITGCGDSYCAALAAQPVFENVESSTSTGMAPGIPTEAPRTIEWSRYTKTYKGWQEREKPMYMLCAISVGGATSRVIEGVERMNALGGQTVGFTHNMTSALAKASQFVVNINTPPFDPAPNVTSYNSSLYAAMMFGLYVSTVKGYMSEAQAKEQSLALMQYVNSFGGGVLDRIEEQAYELTAKWDQLGVDLLDFVSAGADYATAFFGSAKVVEAYGGLTTYDDSEDWNHINFFNRTPERVGTLIVANTTSPSFSRSLETSRVAAAMGRPLAVVTDTCEDIFPESATVFRLPKPKYRWANPLMQHIPLDYIAAYGSILKNITPFRRDNEVHQRDTGERIRASKHVIVL